MGAGAAAAPPAMSTSMLGRFRSCVLAATLITQGESDGDSTVVAPGPLFPAATDANKPAALAAKKESAFGSVQGFRDAPPIEKLMTSTWSSTAWSIAATVADTWQPPAGSGSALHALYEMTCACGATPEIRFAYVIVGATSAASTTLPATVLATWLPWALSSNGVVPVKSYIPISLSLQSTGLSGAQTPKWRSCMGGLKPSAPTSANDGGSWLIPVSMIPATIPSPLVPVPVAEPSWIAPAPIQAGPASVSRRRVSSAWTSFTPGTLSTRAASLGLSCTARPLYAARYR